MSLAPLLGQPAWAAPGATELPTGGQVVAGQATIATSGARMDITQSSSRTVLDWQSFNIGDQAHVHFQQPAGGAALNRVLGSNPSEIYGKLTATGQVFLTNPNGVYFAPGAQGDVGGLVASTLNIAKDDFMAGRLRFAGESTAAVTNAGTLRTAPGGTVALIAARIENQGTIEAPEGQVLLGAGRKVTLDLGLPYKLEVEEGALNALIEQGGAIRAEGGLIYLTARALDELSSAVINHSGYLQANTNADQQGRVVLDGGSHGKAVVSGTVEVSGNGLGEKGGQADVTAEDVHLTATAKINAAGDRGDGAVRIGGDYMGGEATPEDQAQFGLKMGSNPIGNARTVKVDRGAVIDASSRTSGDGDKIVVWSDDSTEFHGESLAKGGVQSGNGGAVEISGKCRVVADGKVDVSAPAGQQGRYVIDPAGLVYSSTANFLNAIRNHKISLGQYVEYNNAIYALTLKTIAPPDYRVDPDGMRSYKASLILTKIVNGNIVAQAELGQLYAGGYLYNNSEQFIAQPFWRLAISSFGSSIKVFAIEKSAGYHYGQDGYLFTVNPDTLVSSRETLFTDKNRGWYPYFDSNGDLWHFSYDGYYIVKNKSYAYSIQPSDAARISQNRVLQSVGLPGNNTSEIPWGNLSSQVYAQLSSKAGGAGTGGSSTGGSSPSASQTASSNSDSGGASSGSNDVGKWTDVFVNDVKGHCMNWDKAYGCQCADLMYTYIEFTYGISAKIVREAIDGETISVADYFNNIKNNGIKKGYAKNEKGEKYLIKLSDINNKRFLNLEWIKFTNKANFTLQKGDIIFWGNMKIIKIVDMLQ